MAAKEILAGKAVVEVGTRLAIQRGLKAAEDTFKKFGATVGKIGAGVAAAGAVAVGAAAAAFTPLLAAAKQFADVGSELDDMAQRTGAAVEGLSALGYAAKQSGTSLQAVEGGIKKSQKAIVDAANGSKELGAAFASLGLDVGRLMNMTPDAQFKAIASAVGQIENPTQRAAMAMQIFGKSGTELLPLMRSNIKELTDEAEKLGLVMSGKNASAAAALGDALDKATDTIQGAFLRIGAAIAPVLTGILDRVTNVAAELGKWIDANQEIVVLIAGLAAAAGVAGSALVAMGGAAIVASSIFSAMATICAGASAVIGFFTSATAGATTVTAAFGAILSAVLAPVYAIVGSIGVAVLAIAALTVAVAAIGGYIAFEAGLVGDAFNFLSSKFWELLGTAQQTLGGVLSAIASGQYALAAQILWAGVKLAFLQGADASLEAVVGLFRNSLSIVSRFNVQLAKLVQKGFEALPQIMRAALTGGSIAQVLSDLVKNNFDLGGVLDNQVATAKQELDGLTAQLQKQQAAAGPSVQPPRARPQAGGPPGSPGAASALPAIANAEADTIESLRAARARHEATSYASGNAFAAAEANLQQRERAIMQRQALEAAKAQAARLATEKSKAPTPGFRTPEAKELGETMAAATDSQVKKTSTVATFTAAAAGMLGGSGGDDRVANNTATQVGLMRRLLKQRGRGPSYS
jgi:TP901 family phage tail tape measure protein